MLLLKLPWLIFHAFFVIDLNSEGPAINTATPPNLSNGDRQKHNITSAVSLFGSKISTKIAYIYLYGANKYKRI